MKRNDFLADWIKLILLIVYTCFYNGAKSIRAVEHNGTKGSSIIRINGTTSTSFLPVTASVKSGISFGSVTENPDGPSDKDGPRGPSGPKGPSGPSGPRQDERPPSVVVSTTKTIPSDKETSTPFRNTIIITVTFVTLLLVAIGLGFCLNRRRTRGNLHEQSSTNSTIVTVVNHQEIFLEPVNNSTSTLNTTCNENDGKKIE